MRGALAMAAGVIVTLLLAAVLQYRTELRNDRAGSTNDSPSPGVPLPDTIRAP